MFRTKLKKNEMTGLRSRTLFFPHFYFPVFLFDFMIWNGKNAWRKIVKPLMWCPVNGRTRQKIEFGGEGSSCPLTPDWGRHRTFIYFISSGNEFHEAHFLLLKMTGIKTFDSLSLSRFCPLISKDSISGSNFKLALT